MEIDFCGRSALVTGAASGIGRAVAEVLATSGARVALADKNLDGVRAEQERLASKGLDVAAFYVELTESQSIIDLERDVNSWCGPCAIIVNAAGWNVGQPFLENEHSFMDTVVALNLQGTMRVCHAFTRVLVESGMAGSIVNVASDAGRVGSLGESVYAGAKGGVIAFSKSLAREMARYGINVNCVSPGPTETPLFRAQPEKVQAALIRAIPFRRLGEPDEIANAVAFLASDCASYITGQVLSVSGGLTMVG